MSEIERKYKLALTQLQAMLDLVFTQSAKIEMLTEELAAARKAGKEATDRDEHNDKTGPVG